MALVKRMADRLSFQLKGVKLTCCLSVKNLSLNSIARVSTVTFFAFKRFFAICMVGSLEYVSVDELKWHANRRYELSFL